MHDLVQILKITWEALAELLPWFFLAIIIGALVELLYLDILARRSFQKHGLLGILLTTALGAFSPFCSFTVIPLIRKLLRGGVPLSAVMAFWIASPAMDPPIFAMTAAQVGLPLATARLLGALALSIGGGLFVLALERRGLLADVLRYDEVKQAPVGVAVGQAVPAYVRATAGSPATACASTTTNVDDEDDGAPWWPTAKASLSNGHNWWLTGRNVVRDSVNLGKWLLLACVFLALIRLYVPADFVTGLLGGKGLLAIPLAVAISVPLYLNGVGAIPIVGGLLLKGMAPGAAVSFLLGGAVTTIPAMVAVRSVVNNRVFAIYLGIGVIGSTALGFGSQLVL